MKSRKRPRLSGQKEMNSKVRALDELAFLDKLKSELLPGFLEAMRSGKSADEILEQYQPYAALRLCSNALFSPSTAASTQAAKDVLDRKMGRPVERKEVEHRLAKVDSRELDAMLLTKLKRAEALPPAEVTVQLDEASIQPDTYALLEDEES